MVESSSETPTQRVTVYLGLGANLSDPRRQVEQALLQLQTLPGSEVTAVSSLYRTLPVGPADQPDFINAVARIDTQLEPLVLLTALQQIERQHGRIRNGQRWGPRTLDLDILLIGEQVLALPQLCVPHPQMHCRAFVLGPLAEIAPPGLEIPGQGRLDDLLAAVADEAGTMVRLRADDSGRSYFSASARFGASEFDVSENHYHDELACAQAAWRAHRLPDLL